MGKAALSHPLYTHLGSPNHQGTWSTAHRPGTEDEEWKSVKNSTYLTTLAHKLNYINRNKKIRMIYIHSMSIIYVYMWGFLEMLFPELCDNSCLRWGPPYNSFILGSSLHMCKILMRSSLCVVFSLARTFLASLGRTAAAAAMHCCCHP